MLKALRQYLPEIYPVGVSKNAEDAYDLWSKTYDFQPDNLMLGLDNLVFNQLIQNVGTEGKIIADIGCGTGRHWQQILDGNPKLLKGFDVSDGMLRRLKEKFPTAIVKKIVDNSFRDEADCNYDIIISTLTIAHIKNVHEALLAWSRILKNGADIIITDFHPKLLARGGKRTFTDKQGQITVINYVHSTDKLKKMFQKQGFFAVKEIEIKIDESLKSYYEKQNALAIFNKFKGVPVIYGLHLKKHDS
jgi:ubiquinone/menaquinone biosynthesis C-methylase UbiE